MVEKQPLQQAILGLLLLWAVIAQATYSGFVIYVQAKAQHFAQVPFYTHAFSTVISEVPNIYAGSGLQPGDTIKTLAGQPVIGEEQLDEIRFRSHPGDRLAVTATRGSGNQAKDIATSIRLQAGKAHWTIAIVLSVFLPAACLLVGFYIAFARPRDPLAWIAMAMLASFGQVAGSGVSWALSSPWQEFLFVYHAVLTNSWPLWLLLFALYFPAPFSWWKRHSWLNWLLALPSLVLAALSIYGFLRAGMHLAELDWLASFVRASAPVMNVWFTLYVFGFFALLGAKRGVAQTPDARRRLNVMIWGCAAALTPLLPVVFLDLPMWLSSLCLLMAVFFPITMAYVIVVQRAMDIRTVVRSGVRYALAANGIKLLRVALIVALVAITIRLEQQSAYRWEGVLIAAVGVGLILMVGRLAQRTSSWMDRRFFREAYDAELILTDLGNSVAGIRDIKTLLHTVSRRISASLHVDRIAILLEQNACYEPAYALGFGGVTPQVTLTREAATIRQLKQARSACKVYFDDPQSWIYGAAESEQVMLRSLQTQLLLPVAMNGRLLGLISLSAKKSEVPYSPGDLQLLGAVASQTGLAIENAELTETIRREIAQRERLDRELEIARDVQQHLFPQTLPRVEGLDFAGYCRPVEGVGGDYYDFVRLSNGRLGVAIGDVSGKGIAAALLMANLQASLRGQTIRPYDSLAEMIGHINRLVYDASADNRYATFFYAEYDPQNRQLRYVNAGHNAPMILHKAGGDPVRLTDGGTVVGLFPDCLFDEGRIPLEPGDILVAYTDGVSEAMNQLDEEFDDAQIIDAVAKRRSRTAADLISEILERVDRFTAGARQHDDMTLVVLRVQ